MSASLLRGLRILEMLREEPLGVTELARRLCVDKAGVSRVVAALEVEGWVERTGRRCVLGPRALSLGGGVGDAATLARAGATVRALGTRTGLTAVALRVAGTGAQPLAIEEAEAGTDFRRDESAFDHLVSTAAGIVLLAQLPDEVVRSHLAVDPWPTLGADAPSGPDAAWALVEQVRDARPAVESGWTTPGLACVALPWPDLGPGAAALAVIGPDDDVSGRLDELVEALGEAVGRPR